LLEGGLAVLADHHEGRQEDGLERDDQRQCRPRALLEHQHPQREQHSVEVDEVHRARERGDLVGDAKLGVVSPLLPLGDDRGMVKHARVEGPGAEEAARRLWLLLYVSVAHGSPPTSMPVLGSPSGAFPTPGVPRLLRPFAPRRRRAWIRDLSWLTRG